MAIAGTDLDQPRFPRRFRTRLFLYIAALSLATSITSAAVYYRRQIGFIETDRARRAKTILTTLATEAELGAYAADASLCEAAARRTFAEDDVVLVAVYDRRGEELLRYSAPAIAAPPLDPARLQRIASDGRTVERLLIEDTHGDGFEDLYAPIVTLARRFDDAAAQPRAASRLETVGLARVGLSLRPAREQLAEVVHWGVYLAVGLLAVGLGAALLISRRIAEPLAALTHGAEELRAGRLDARVEIASRDEIGQLAHAFNRMAEQLQAGIGALARVNSTLEAEVHRRTAELERAAVELEARNAVLSHQRDQLQEMNRLKSEFLASVSHELRTPLNAIIGYGELLHDGIYGDVTDGQRAALSGIDESGRSLLHLIDQILDLSKVEAGKMTIEIEEVAIDQVIDRLVAEAAALARDRPYRIAFDRPAHPVTVRTDAVKLRQILGNFISNAIKFTAAGAVTVSLRPRAAGGCTIEVNDTGIGIRQEHMAIIFDEFRQIDGSYRRAFGGTGLGLAIAKRFAALIGGTISVTSTFGEGSTFRLDLPAAPEPPAPSERSA